MGGKLIMVGVDSKETKKRKREIDLEERKKAKAEAFDKKDEERKFKLKKQREHTQQNIPDKVMEPEEEGSKENQDNEEWKPEEIDEFKKIERNFIDIGPFVAEVCRYSVSDRAASAMFNAAVKCLNTAGYIVPKEGESFEEKLNTDKFNI